MTEPEARAEKLARELDSAFRNRADLYRLFLDELTAELGAERAEAVMIRTITQRGREVAAAAFADFGPNDARAIGEAFLAVSPDGGRMMTLSSTTASGFSRASNCLSGASAWTAVSTIACHGRERTRPAGSPSPIAGP